MSTHQAHRLDADRHLGVVLDNEVLPANFPPDGHDVEAHLPVRHAPEAGGDRGVVERAALYDLCRDDLVLAALQPPQPLVYGEHALGQAAFENPPVCGGDHTGKVIGRMRRVPGDPEATLLFEHPIVGAADPPVPLPGPHLLHLPEHRPVVREGPAVGHEDLVGAGEFALESYVAISHQLLVGWRSSRHKAKLRSGRWSSFRWTVAVPTPWLMAER